MECYSDFCSFPIVFVVWDAILSSELPYRFCGTECYSEYCVFEEAGKVGGFHTYVGECGSLMLCFSGCCLSCWVLDGGFSYNTQNTRT